MKYYRDQLKWLIPCFFSFYIHVADKKMGFQENIKWKYHSSKKALADCQSEINRKFYTVVRSKLSHSLLTFILFRNFRVHRQRRPAAAANSDVDRQFDDDLYLEVILLKGNNPVTDGSFFPISRWNRVQTGWLIKQRHN